MTESNHPSAQGKGLSNSERVCGSGHEPGKANRRGKRSSLRTLVGSFCERASLTATLRLVRGLPARPLPEGHYVFNGITRSDVTALNHGLHKYPAKFIPQLPSWALRYSVSTRGMTILDPFCGSGTTLVEAGLLGNCAIGFDVNPLAALISRAKTAIFAKLNKTPQEIVDEIVRMAARIAPGIQKRLIRAITYLTHPPKCAMLWT